MAASTVSIGQWKPLQSYRTRHGESGVSPRGGSDDMKKISEI